METNKKLRIIGGAVTFLAILYYGYQSYIYITNWESLNDIQSNTECDQVFSIELWLLSQNLIWIGSLGLVLLVLILPELYKLLLCFLYLMGPFYLAWTLVAIGYFASFLTCCTENDDKCTDYYPYQNPAGFIALLVVSLIFSGLITIYLLVIISQVLVSYFRSRFQQYSDLDFF